MGHAIVGTLTHDARNVEVVRPTDDQRWGLVNHGEGTAWASLRFLRRQPGHWAGAVPPLARCFGTEPFWSLRFEGDAVRLTALSASERPEIGWISDWIGSTNRRDRHALILLWASLQAGYGIVRTELGTGRHVRSRLRDFDRSSRTVGGRVSGR